MENGADNEGAKEKEEEPAKETSNSLNMTAAATLDPQLYRLIRQILPSSDPLDDPEFSPTDYINSLFPNEQSLVDLDTVIAKMRLRARKIDYEVATDVRFLSRTGDKGKSDLLEAQQSISQLWSKISDIKRKAEASEVMVQEICADIKSLDHAKRHLTATITALRRIHMLMTGVEQLREWASKKQYREVGNLLEAVNQLSGYFSSYNEIPRVRLLNEQINMIKKGLKDSVYEEFKALERSSSPTPPAHLADVCFVIEALGPEERSEFIKWFCQSRMKEYSATFRPSDDSSRLEHCERRYMWMKKELHRLDKQFDGIFPPSWGMAACVCEEFCKVTRARLVEMLDQDNPSVTSLLKALRDTLLFESEMVKQFSVLPLPLENEKQQTLAPMDGDDEEEQEIEDNDRKYSEEAMKKRLEKFKRQQEKKKAMEKLKSEGENEGLTRAKKRFRGVISSAFDPYMKYYVQEEDNLMAQKLQGVLEAETWERNDDYHTRLLESCQLIVDYFNKAMRRCSNLNRSHGFFEMYKLFKKYWGKYKEALENKLTSFQANGDGTLNEKQERTTCLIINTAEYCGKMCEQMSEAIKKIIDPSYAPDINVASEQEEFNRVVVRGVKSLASSLQVRIDGALQMMAKMPWGSWEMVGDQSEYVGHISTYVERAVPLYNSLLNTMHFRFFCDSLVGQLVPSLLQAIFKCRQISEVGAEQLLLDMTAVKSVLLSIPTLGSNDGKAPSRYTKLITKEMGKIEMFLKVLMAKPEGLASTYLALVQDSTESQFHRLMDLKGIPKQDQQFLLEQYRTKKKVR